ncbi:MAG: radical SAM protein [Planctomycetota bacterium]
MAGFASFKALCSQVGEKLRHPNRTPRKLINFFLYLLEQKGLQHELAWNMPTEAFIDVCSLCTLRCPLCPTGIRLNVNRKGKITMGQFKPIVDQIAPWVFDLHLYNWGEPLLNREIFALVKYAKSKNVRVLISSHLNHLPEGWEREMVESRLDVLMVSLDGVSQESYEKYRVGGNFDRVIENIRRIVAEKKSRQSSRPFIEWRFLVMRHNEHEQDEARRMAAEIGVDRIVFEPVRVNTYLDIFTPISDLIESDLDWLPVSDHRYDHDARAVRSPQGRCPQPWRWVSIDWNGDVFPCCSIYDDEFAFGNMLERDFRRIWNGRAFREARRIVSRRGMREKSGNVCSYCHRYNVRYRKKYPNRSRLIERVRVHAAKGVEK